ncbi:MAG: hypothetical protein JZU65_05610 [Chlorobium sp.]|nr:hypothetical protein [Chlorobium sp.]
MANSITTTYLMNGSKYFIAKIDFICDTTAELTAVDAIAIASLTGLPAKFKIRNISWQLSDFYVKMFWDATADVPAITLNQYEGDIDFFCEIGAPLINNAGAGVTGKLQLTTVGLKAGSGGTIFIKGYH